MKIPVIAHLLLILGTAQGGYAPRESPKLPDGFCPKETGTITETTGGKEEELRSHLLCVDSSLMLIDNILSECMCDWQHKDGCVGSKCQYQYGLSFYHFSCDDCKCVKKPS